ncbi:hypothetical protein M885DRAFT_578215 [Pelagophyceae sp. CCMP2097]|nr:hypothetical protein M885DRAFT_578215 [Pelagophyceae sp. CCMP2097]
MRRLAAGLLPLGAVAWTKQRVDAGRGAVTVRVPAGPPPARGWPAVLLLPGYGETAKSFEAQFGLRDVVDAAGFVQIEAQGREDGGGYPYWMAWGSCCGGCYEEGTDGANDWYTYYYSDGGGIKTNWPRGRTHDQGWQNMLDRCAGGDSDVAYARALVAAVAAAVPIDAMNVAALGQSNGAYMAYRLACDAAGVFSAVVAQAGAPPTSTETAHFTLKLKVI